MAASIRQGASSQSNPGGTFTNPGGLFLASATLSGSTIIVAFANSAFVGPRTFTCTDTLGQTYTQVDYLTRTNDYNFATFACQNSAVLPAATAVTFTGAISSGASSATLSSAWALPTRTYIIKFSTGETRVTPITNGSTAVTWGDGLGQSATSSASIGFGPYVTSSSDEDFMSCSVLEIQGVPTSGVVVAHNALVQVGITAGANKLNPGSLACGTGSGLLIMLSANSANGAGSPTNTPVVGTTPVAFTKFGSSFWDYGGGNPGAMWQSAHLSNAGTITPTAGATETASDDYFSFALFLADAVVTAPFVTPDVSSRVTTNLIASDFSPPNLLADQILKLPPFVQKELPGWTIRAKGNYTDFAPPNLLADQILKLPPFTQAELPGVMLRGRGITDFIHPNLIESTLQPASSPLTPVDLSQQVKKAASSDFSPPNLLTQQTLKLPPFTFEEFPGWSLRARALGTDFTAPNLLSLTLTTPAAPLLAIDLSQQVKSRWVGSDFNPGNLLLGILPAPPVAPIDATVSIRAKGVFTDFSPPNLSLNTLFAAAPLLSKDFVLRLEYRWIRGDDLPINLLPLKLQTVTPLAPQDLSGIRLDARGLRSDFVPPNLTLTLPVPPPPPVSTGAGRHGTRRQARRRRELDVLRARIEAFKEQRADADRALIAIDDRELAARAKLLKRVRVKPLVKPIEEYAPIKKALAQRNVAADRYKSILAQIRAHQLEAERIQREIETEDEEAALHLMHYLMMESWYE